MDIVNHENEPINKSNVQIEIANSRHNKPRRANITPQGILSLWLSTLPFHGLTFTVIIKCTVMST